MTHYQLSTMDISTNETKTELRRSTRTKRNPQANDHLPSDMPMVQIQNSNSKVTKILKTPSTPKSVQKRKAVVHTGAATTTITTLSTPAKKSRHNEVEIKKDVEIKPKEIKRRRDPPTFIRASIPNCPFCPYTSEFLQNTARHFQCRHKLEFKQLLTGSAVYPGFEKKEVSEADLEKLLMSLNTPLFDPAALAAAELRRKNRKPEPPILIVATISNCPLCQYCSYYSGNLARHFQNKHKLECSQVLSGVGNYPGISKKEIREVKKKAKVINISEEKDSLQFTTICTTNTDTDTDTPKLADPKECVNSQVEIKTEDKKIPLTNKVRVTLGITATVNKCPLCPYSDDCFQNTARHFQWKHPLEFVQVLKGEIQYPGILIRKETSPPSKKKLPISLVVQNTCTDTPQQQAESKFWKSDKPNALDFHQIITGTKLEPLYEGIRLTEMRATDGLSALTELAPATAEVAQERLKPQEIFLEPTPIQESEAVKAFKNAWSYSIFKDNALSLEAMKAIFQRKMEWEVQNQLDDVDDNDKDDDNNGLILSKADTNNNDNDSDHGAYSDRVSDMTVNDITCNDSDDNNGEDYY